MQPKSYKNPKIALLNIELELKAERDNAEIRVESVKVGIYILFTSTILLFFSNIYFNYYMFEI